MKKTIGVIGPGRHFKKNIYPAIKKSRFFNLTGVLKKKKEEFKGIKNFREKLFFKQNFDFIYISCPNSFHEKFIIKSIKAGSHVICDKPFILSKKNINKIIFLSKKHNKLIFEAFMFLYHPVFKYVKKTIQTKKYGDLKYVISNFRFPSLDKNNNRYKKTSGKGFYFDSACYLISLETNLFKNDKVNFYTQKIKKYVDLRGNIFINSLKTKRFYFWGEGQIYSNSIELFFKKATIFIDKFFSKNNYQNVIVKVFKNNKIETINIKKINQFLEMFADIQKNYTRKDYKEYHRKIIREQINNLLRYEKNTI